MKGRGGTLRATQVKHSGLLKTHSGHCRYPDVIPEAMTQTELPVSRTCPVFLPVLAAAGNEHQCFRKERRAKYTRKGSRRD